MDWYDEWPSMADGARYDGKRLMELVREGRNPFDGRWDFQLLLQEIEQHLSTQISDIPLVTKGSNNLGIELKTCDGRDLVARLARSDVNIPGFDGFTLESQVLEVNFEAAVYKLLESEPAIKASRMLYHRTPVQRTSLKDEMPKDLAGRRLFVFEKAQGIINAWEDLSPEGKLRLLDQMASMRASLFKFELPRPFTLQFLHDRIFNFKPESFALTVAPTREFWVHVFSAKIGATIKNSGDMIGWEDDDETVGPIAMAAKQSLLRVIPLILPEDLGSPSLYRLVLEHGDFGIHNVTVKQDQSDTPQVTSLFDWETGCIWPALLSDPLVAAGPVDLIVDELGAPAVTRIPQEANSDNLREYQKWAEHYVTKLYLEAPDLQVAIEAGKDARYLWYALRDWRGGDSEGFFQKLGTWAEELFNKKSA